jgi:hypothetical protein
LSTGKGPIPRVLVGDFGEGHVEGSGKVGTGTVEVISPFADPADVSSIQHRSSLDVRIWMRYS